MWSTKEMEAAEWTMNCTSRTRAFLSAGDNPSPGMPKSPFTTTNLSLTCATKHATFQSLLLEHSCLDMFIPLSLEWTCVCADMMLISGSLSHAVCISSHSLICMRSLPSALQDQHCSRCQLQMSAARAGARPWLQLIMSSSSACTICMRRAEVRRGASPRWGTPRTVYANGKEGALIRRPAAAHLFIGQQRTHQRRHLCAKS